MKRTHTNWSDDSKHSLWLIRRKKLQIVVSLGELFLFVAYWTMIPIFSPRSRFFVGQIQIFHFNWVAGLQFFHLPLTGLCLILCEKVISVSLSQTLSLNVTIAVIVSVCNISFLPNFICRIYLYNIVSMLKNIYMATFIYAYISTSFSSAWYIHLCVQETNWQRCDIRVPRVCSVKRNKFNKFIYIVCHFLVIPTYAIQCALFFSWMIFR